MPSIVRDDLEQLVQEWMQAEKDGVRFPVPLHEYWWIAGHSAKRRAFDLAKSILEKNVDFEFLTGGVKNPGRGRSSDSMRLTIDGLNHLCLAAKTSQGRVVRQLFIEAKRKWDIVQQQHPAIAQEVEIAHLQAQMAQDRRLAMEAEERILARKEYIVTALPEPVQQKILGYKTVERVEYRDRILKDDDIIRDGSTVNKTALCHDLGILTKAGKPDYRSLNKALAAMDLPSEAWQLTCDVRENSELRREYLDTVRRQWLNGDRQRYIGE